MSNALKHLYLVRHGQTIAAKDQVIGASDEPLSDHGARQAIELAKSFSFRNSITLYSSELSRAKHTASLIGGNKTDVECSNLINEMDFGDWEKQTWDAVYNHDPDFFNHWAQNWITVPPPNGESFSDVIKRCGDWYNQTLKSNNCAVVVAHGGSLRALMGILLGLPADCVFNFEFDHCHVSKININQNINKAAYLNIPYIK